MRSTFYLLGGLAALALHAAPAAHTAAFAKTSSAPPFLCIGPDAVDGDTIKCGTLRGRGNRFSVRLTGIDAPELAGHCRAGRVCVVGDPIRSRAILAAFIAGHKIWITPVGTDKYRRTLAIVHRVKLRSSFRRTANAACHQLANAAAIYVAKWDNGKIIARECGL